MTRNNLIAGGALAVLVVILLISLSPDAPEEVAIDANSNDVTVGPIAEDSTANATEIATSDTGAASNAATDEAVAEIAEGNAPTTDETVDATRDIAAEEGVVGASAFTVADYDPAFVRESIATSELDETVETDLAADLDAAEDDSEELETALSDIRDALGLTDN